MNTQMTFGADGLRASVSADLTDAYLDALDYVKRCELAVAIACKRESTADMARAERALNRARSQLNDLVRSELA